MACEKLLLPERLIVVRHVESVQNLIKNTELANVGQLDLASYEATMLTTRPNQFFPPSERGYYQGQALRDFVSDPANVELQNAIHRAINDNQVYDSGFTRTQYTRWCLAGEHGQSDDDLRERSYGPFDDPMWDKDDPELAALWAKHKEGYWGNNMGGQGENFADVAARAERFLRRVAGKQAVLAATHGDYMRVMRRLIEGVPECEIIPTMMGGNEPFPIYNAIILEYKVAAGALQRRYQYPQIGNSPMPAGAGEWMQIERAA
jgi:broad specificity phosphatase PhoE